MKRRLTATASLVLIPLLVIALLAACDGSGEGDSVPTVQATPTITPTPPPPSPTPCAGTGALSAEGIAGGFEKLPSVYPSFAAADAEELVHEHEGEDHDHEGGLSELFSADIDLSQQATAQAAFRSQQPYQLLYMFASVAADEGGAERVRAGLDDEPSLGETLVAPFAHRIGADPLATAPQWEDAPVGTDGKIARVALSYDGAPQDLDIVLFLIESGGTTALVGLFSVPDPGEQVADVLLIAPHVANFVRGC